MKRLVVGILVGVGGLFAQATQAALIEKPPLDSVIGLNSNQGLDHERIADDFQLDTPGQTSLVAWYGYWYQTSALGDFEISFYEDASGLPKDTPFYSQTLTDVSSTTTGLT